MADISKITLPSGTTYNIKDAEARSAIASITSFDYVICTNAANTPQGVTWESGSTTITGTLVASADTKGKMYLVPDSLGTKDIYDEYITINTSGSTYIWERFGHTGGSIGDLGDLAYKDSASGSFTPHGNVTAQFSGNEMSLVYNLNDEDNDPYEVVTNVALYKGSTSSVTREENTPIQYVESIGSASFSGTATTFTPKVTATGNVSAPTITKSSAGSTTTVNSITAVGTLPSWTGTVANENLTIAWSAGTLPTKGSDTTVKTGDASYTASAPTFTGTKATGDTISYTPAGTVTVTPTQKYFKYDGDYSSKSITITGTPTGNITNPRFIGYEETITVS